MIAFNRLWERMMNYKADVRLVYTCIPIPMLVIMILNSQGSNEKNKCTHSKCHRSTDNVDFVFTPLFLDKGTLSRIHTTMVKCCFMPTFLNKWAILKRSLIDKGRSVTIQKILRRTHKHTCFNKQQKMHNGWIKNPQPKDKKRNTNSLRITRRRTNQKQKQQ